MGAIKGDTRSLDYSSCKKGFHKLEWRDGIFSEARVSVGDP